MTTPLDLTADGGALRTRLSENDWTAAVLAAENPPLPEWATPRVDPPANLPADLPADFPADPPASPEVPDTLREALDLRRRAVVVVEVASHDGGVGVLVDQTIAILRQGVSNAGISVHVEYLGPDGKPVSVSNTRDFPGDIDQRYGPQPGSGLPPTGPPVPTPTEWPPPPRSEVNPDASV